MAPAATGAPAAAPPVTMATLRPRLAARNPTQVASGPGSPGLPFAGSPSQGRQRVSSAAVTASDFPALPRGTRSSPRTAPNSENFSTTPGWGCGVPRLPRHCPKSLGPEFCIPEIPRNYLDKKDVAKVPKSRQNGRLLVYDSKEKVMIDTNKEVSRKCCFGLRPRLASKLCAQISPGAANTFSAKKEASSKKNENKVSFKNSKTRPSSRSIESKDHFNQHLDLWSSSFLKESTGEAGKDLVLVKQQKNSEYCLEDLEKLSESTDGDGEDDSNDDDDGAPVRKETRAPLELMAEFLRAEMGRDYQLAQKLCQMILIYEPENPVAKEFFSLIEEILLKEKAQKSEDDEEDSEEDTSSESEAESSEDASDDSSDECEDGS